MAAIHKVAKNQQLLRFLFGPTSLQIQVFSTKCPNNNLIPVLMEGYEFFKDDILAEIFIFGKFFELWSIFKTSGKLTELSEPLVPNVFYRLTELQVATCSLLELSSS